MTETNNQNAYFQFNYNIFFMYIFTKIVHTSSYTLRMHDTCTYENKNHMFIFINVQTYNKRPKGP